MVYNDYLTEVLVDLIRGLIGEFHDTRVSLYSNICRVDNVYITEDNRIKWDFEPEFFGEDEEGKYMAHTCTDEMIMVCIYQTLQKMLTNK